jgi:hypothetical protein
MTHGALVQMIMWFRAKKLSTIQRFNEAIAIALKSYRHLPFGLIKFSTQN